MTQPKQIRMPPGWFGVCEWTDADPAKPIPESRWHGLKAHDDIPQQATALRVYGLPIEEKGSD
jgi:hypothetical protein